MLKFLYGKAGAGKNDYIFRAAGENSEKKAKTFILVPEQFSMQTEHSVIERLGAKAQTYVEVLTFSRLCNMVMGFAGPVQMKHIDGAGKYIAAQRCMQRLEPRLSVFKSNVHQKGFAKIAVNTISEFKRYGVAPEDLRAAAENESVAGAGFADKLSELALIYEEYNAEINERGADTEDNLALVIPRIRKCGGFLSGSLFVSGFKSFTPLEETVLGELMQMFGEVCVSLVTDDLKSNEPQFSSASATFRRLCGLANSIGIPVGELIFLSGDAFSNAPRLGFLRDNFFGASACRFEGGDGGEIELYAPADYYAEVRTAAKLILRLCREEGYRYGDIMLLTRSPENYDRIIPSVFGRHGISVFLDAKYSIMQNPLLRCICAVLDILTYGFSYERVMTLLRSGFCGVSTDEIDIFENYILKADPSHAMWSRAGEWDYNPDPAAYDMELINRVGAAASAPIKEIRKSLSGRKTCAQICAALLGWLDGGVRERLTERINGFTNSGRHTLADEYRQAWNSAVTLILQLGELMGGDFVTFESFSELFTSAAKECTVGLTPTSLDSVTVGEIDRFRRNDAKAVIVLGVTDGVFPKKYMNEGILSDAEREMLRETGVELAPTAISRNIEEQALIYSVLTSAKEKLILSAPVSDGRGTALRPSSIFTAVRDMFDLEARTLGAEDEFEGGDAALDFLAARAASGIDEDEPIVRAALEYFSENERFRGRVEEIGYMLARVRRRDTLSAEDVRLLYGETARLSVSKLEKYNSCAFAYFLQYGLLLRERDRAGFEPSNMGTVIHAALEKYLRSLKESSADYGAVKKDECFGAVAELVEREAGGGEDAFCETSSYYRYLVMRMKRIAAATAWEVVRFYAQSEFRPLGTEIRIGEGGDLPPREIRTNSGSAVLEGFIDRADCAEINGEKYMAVTDYKLSGKSLDVELASLGLRFQPLVYADILRGGGYSPAAMLYMATSDPIEKFDEEPSDEALECAVRRDMRAQGWVLDDKDVCGALDKNMDKRGAAAFIRPQLKISRDEFEGFLSDAARQVERTAENILSGKIDVNPVTVGEHDSCKYCKFSTVCGIEKNGRGR